MDAYVVQGGFGLADDGPTGYWAHVRVLGRTRPIWATHPLRGLYIINTTAFFLFLRVGLCSTRFFAGDVAARGAVDEIAAIKVR